MKRLRCSGEARSAARGPFRGQLPTPAARRGLLTAYSRVLPQELPSAQGSFLSQGNFHQRWGTETGPLASIWGSSEGPSQLQSSPRVRPRPLLQLSHSPAASLPRPASLTVLTAPAREPPFQSLLLGERSLRPPVLWSVSCGGASGMLLSSRTPGRHEEGDRLSGLQSAVSLLTRPVHSKWLRFSGSSVNTEARRHWRVLANLLTSPAAPPATSTSCACLIVAALRDWPWFLGTGYCHKPYLPRVYGSGPEGGSCGFCAQTLSQLCGWGCPSTGLYCYKVLKMLPNQVVFC